MEFGQEGWMLDAPLNLQGEPAEELSDRNTLQLVLVDTESNQVVAVRSIDTHPRFAQLIQDGVAEQATRVGDARTVTDVVALLQRDNTTQDLLAAEGVELFQSGEPLN